MSNAYIGTVVSVTTTAPLPSGGTTLGASGETTQTDTCRNSFGGTLLAFTQGYNTGPTSVSAGGVTLTEVDDVASANVHNRLWIGSGTTVLSDVMAAAGYGFSDYRAQILLFDADVSGSPTVATQSFGDGRSFPMPALGPYAPTLTIDSLDDANNCAAIAVYWPSSDDYIAFWAFGWNYGSPQLFASSPDVSGAGYDWLTYGGGAGSGNVYWATPRNIVQSFGTGPYVDVRFRASQPDENSDGP